MRRGPKKKPTHAMIANGSNRATLSERQDELKTTAKLRKPASVKKSKLFFDICELLNKIKSCDPVDVEVIKMVCHWAYTFDQAVKDGDQKLAAIATDKYVRLAHELHLTPAQRAGIPANETKASETEAKETYFNVVS